MPNKFVPVLVGSLIVVFSFVSASAVRADWLIDQSGTLVEVDGFVLGDDDQDDSSSNRDDDGDDDRGDDDGDGDDRDDDHDDDSPQQETKRREAERTREAEKDAAETRREVKQKRLETATEARIKNLETRRETIKSKLEVEDGQLRVRQEVENEDGKVVRTNRTDISPQERLRVEHEDGSLFEINAVEGDKLEIVRDRIKARTDHPLSIGDNNELIVTRPDGTEKVVTVLPDTAADNLRARGLEPTSEEVELEVEGETPVYHFDTQAEKRFLGLFKFVSRQRTSVSAETGEVVGSESAETSPWRRLLDRLPF